MGWQDLRGGFREIAEVNADLEDEPEKMNEDPYGQRVDLQDSPIQPRSGKGRTDVPG